MTGERIRAMRRKLGWSQERMARELSTYQTLISRWETGVHIPKGLYKRTLEEMEQRVNAQEKK